MNIDYQCHASSKKYKVSNECTFILVIYHNVHLTTVHIILNSHL